MNLDNDFLERMKLLLKEDYASFFESLSKPIQKAIYVNEHKMSVEKFQNIVDFSVEKIPYERAGFYVDSTKRGRHPLHHAGAFYMQEPSAMFTVNAIEFKGDEKVLDMCAAPGGKSIQIANKIPNGLLVSNEIVKSRCEILMSNIERMGLSNVIVANDKPQNIAKAYANCFDVCLVDAPCSGEGMFRRGEEVSSQWNKNLDEMCQIRQLEILDCADKALKEGGILIYSTCTYSQKENEDVVRKFLEENEYELINVNYPHSKGIDMPEVARLYPHENRGEGQFVAVLRKMKENNLFCSSSVKLQLSKNAMDFVKKYTLLKDNIYEFKEECFVVKDSTFIKKDVNYMALGVKVGTMKNKRFEPHHNLFSAYGNLFLNRIQLDYKDVAVSKYLHGETLDLIEDFGKIEKDCYGSIVVDGCSLGGFKMSNGSFKNHYPKGLRNFN